MTRKLIVYHLPVVLWLAFIFAASTVSNFPGSSSIKFHIDKVAHFIEYCVLGFLLCRSSYYSGTVRDFKRSALITFGVAIFFAAANELYQLYIPNRMASLADFLADCCGICASLLIYNRYVKRQYPNE